MARIRKSKADTKNFHIIPKEHELRDEELLRRKYGKKKLLIKSGDKDEQRESS